MLSLGAGVVLRSSSHGRWMASSLALLHGQRGQDLSMTVGFFGGLVASVSQVGSRHGAIGNALHPDPNPSTPENLEAWGVFQNELTPEVFGRDTHARPDYSTAAGRVSCRALLGLARVRPGACLNLARQTGSALQKGKTCHSAVFPSRLIG